MSQINPFTPVIPMTQRGQQLQAERVRRAQSRARNGDETEEHQVETADAVVHVHDGEHQQPQGERQHPQKDKAGEDARPKEKPRLDVTA